MAIDAIVLQGNLEKGREEAIVDDMHEEVLRFSRNNKEKNPG